MRHALFEECIQYSRLLPCTSVQLRKWEKQAALVTHLLCPLRDLGRIIVIFANKHSNVALRLKWMQNEFTEPLASLCYLWMCIQNVCVRACVCACVCVCVCVCEIVCISFPGGITEIPSHLIYEEIICCHMVTLDLYKLQLWLVEGLWIFLWWKNETCLQISVYFYALNSSDRKLCDSEEKHC